MDRLPEVITLTDLPLSDHASGGDGTVADAARKWREGRLAAVDRDREAALAEEQKRLSDAAYAQGVSDGRAAAEADGLELVQQLAARLEQATLDCEAVVRREVQLQAHEIVSCAAVIARWALGREVLTDPEVLLGVAARALAESGGAEGARVYVHPDLGVAASRWASRFGIDRPEVYEDPSLAAGEVTVRSASGGVGTVSVNLIMERALTALDADPAVDTESEVLSEETAPWISDGTK